MERHLKESRQEQRKGKKDNGEERKESRREERKGEK